MAFKDRKQFSGYIRQNIGNVVRLSLLIEIDSAHFRADNYLNAVSPTPIHSFLTANYRARVSSKVWRKCSTRRCFYEIFGDGRKDKYGNFFFRK